jgi:hypothetical protein
MRTLSFGIVDERAVFLDERTDSYFMLDSVSEKHLHRMLQTGKPLECDTALLEALGTADEQVVLRQADYPRASESLLDRKACRANALEIVKAFHLVLRARTQLRTESIEGVLDGIFARKYDGVIDEPRRERVVLQAARFLAARRLVPIERNCLLDSLSLLLWLGRSRSSLALLFGVKLHPFSAHCWVQSGELLLNDRVETVGAFTPVRVIRCSEATP